VRGWGLAVALAVTWAGPALAQASDPGFAAREAQNFADSLARPLVWAASPGFMAAPETPDPARDVGRWNGWRGQARAVAWRNRYGARIAGHLFRPLRGDGPFPAVVVVSGAGNPESSYWWAAEDLAEHGYVALTFDPQGQGASDVAPDPRYCDPTGDWRKPQEMGVREQGPCAGENPDDEAVRENREQVVFVAQAKGGHEDPSSIAGTYRELAPRFILGTLDATAFLLSDSDPWRSAVDATRLGVVGHSVGAYAANMVGNGDPAHRFRAAVAMDAFYADDLGVHARVPTLIMQSEQEDVIGPHATPPADPRSPTTLHPTRANFTDLRHRAVDGAFVVLRASTHDDFTDLFAPASRVGQRTAAWLLLAWMDEYVAGRPGLPRMLARHADASADVSSIGTGMPRIAGTAVRDLLSELYPSDLTLAGRLCLDLRDKACPAPPSCAPALTAGVRRARGAVIADVALPQACGRVHVVGVSVRDHRVRIGVAHALAGPADAPALPVALPRAVPSGRLSITVRLDGARRCTLRLARGRRACAAG